MIDFNISIADCKISISSIYHLAADYCHKYIIDNNCQPDFSIKISSSDIEEARRGMAESDLVAGHAIRQFSDANLELIALQHKIAYRLLDYDTLLIHGSCVAVDGMGYLFTAKSGTGKSTHTRMWRECFQNRALMVNDDMPFVKVFSNDRVAVYGSPWNGKERLDTNTSVPLCAVAALHRGSTNRIYPVEQRKRLGIFLNSVYFPRDSEKRLKVISLADRILNNVEFYHLECNISHDAVWTAYNRMRIEPSESDNSKRSK